MQIHKIHVKYLYLLVIILPLNWDKFIKIISNLVFIGL